MRRAGSALDVSIQAQILNLFADLKEQSGYSYLFISHDLSVVERISDRVAVMYLGRIVETGPVGSLFARPQHPYTQALMEAAPRIGRARRTRKPIRGEIPSPSNPPAGCAFHPRCPHAMAICREIAPAMTQDRQGALERLSSARHARPARHTPNQLNQRRGQQMLTILENASVVDVDTGELKPDCRIVLEDAKIAEVGAPPFTGSNARRIDLKGLSVMPGLIDCHCHVLQSTSNLAALAVESPLYAAARAFEIMKGMLHRGFTTIRDAGGADFGIARAVAEGRVEGPRVIYCGKALTATGGHGDYRSGGQYYEDPSYWIPRISRLCDGVSELRRAVRDEVRKGAHHIKIMANGGVASPTDRITSDQYSEEEIAAVVDEAEMAGLYVMSHTYTARSIQRAVRNGVRSIEHGNLADEETLRLIKSKRSVSGANSDHLQGVG